MIASNVGSTAYSFSAGGVPLPFGDHLFAFTPNNQIKPIIVGPLVLSSSDVIRADVYDPSFRPAVAIADSKRFGAKIQSVRVSLAKDEKYSLMFDPDNLPHAKIAKIQFPRPSTCGR